MYITAISTQFTVNLLSSSNFYYSAWPSLRW